MLLNRRTLLKTLGAGAVGAALSGGFASRAYASPLTRPIPASGEALPLVGLGSWITFNVGNDQVALDSSADVIAAFFEHGGRLIDSSPMYASSQSTIGYGLKKAGYPAQLFSAEKVWTSSASEGPEQMAETRDHWGVPHFDLMQIHNFVAWRAHLETLRAMKAAGQLRYIGITTSHGRRHDLMEKIMTSEAIDFVQLTYNVGDRDVEQRILPLAKERGIGVIVNRPYQRGALIRRLSHEPLPKWARETGATNWPQFLLKFVISHPAVTCAIPATTQVAHVKENLTMADGILPDMALRQRMVDYVEQL